MAETLQSALREDLFRPQDIQCIAALLEIIVYVVVVVFDHNERSFRESIEQQEEEVNIDDGVFLLLFWELRMRFMEGNEYEEGKIFRELSRCADA